MIQKDRLILPRPAIATRSFGLVIVVLGGVWDKWDDR